MSDSTIEQILKLASGRADSAEVYYLSSQDTAIEFEKIASNPSKPKPCEA